MQAAAIEILVEKAHFEPKVALAIAEAIDMAIGNSQLVTVPVLDVRFAAVEAQLDTRFAKIDVRFAELRSELKQDMKELKAELVRWVFLVMLGNVALTAGITAILNALQRGA